MKNRISLAAVILLSAASVAQAGDSEAHFQITITNITKGTLITPVLAATHSSAIEFFTLGEPASDEIAQIAEGGNFTPLKTVLDASPAVYHTATAGGPLMPGETTMLTIDAPKFGLWWTQLSLAAMMVPTNDTFVSLNGVALPVKGSVTYLAEAYDAGSEPNDELCTHVPGPACGGEAYSPGTDGEGYVYPSPATHGEGDLSAATYRWSGPVAKITVKRMK